MILLQPDCLVFRTADGEDIPCSVQEVTLELMGESATLVDEAVVRDAAVAVLNYFKQEVGTTLVSVGEFAQALERVLKGFGFDVQDPETTPVTGAQPDSQPAQPKIVDSDLSRLARTSGKAFELVFFPILREELRRQLRRSPAMVRFLRLRHCVKQLLGAKRWTRRCQNLNDQIIDFLRTSLDAEKRARHCTLWVES